jgi:hypothetical protein
MPFALLIVGAFLLIAAVRGTTDGPSGLFALVAGDFTGSPNFTFWIVAILLIGAIGYIQKVKPLSDAMLALVILVLFLSKGNPGAVGGGFFTQFTNALNTTTTATPSAATMAAVTQGTTAAQSLLNAQPGTVFNSDGSVNPILSTLNISPPAATTATPAMAASNALPASLTSLPQFPGITENL